MNNEWIQDPGFWNSKKVEKLGDIADVQERTLGVLARSLDSISFQLMLIEVTLVVLLVCLIFVIGAKK